ncbi:MAG TPA: dicarboxylate/amino acid:cation symporter [Candidatus Dormibacteraeota bacterium]|nr:dicarboxylate/amino acid:cation symporter [Candidatus Dormibacteraeota bacterium]
MQPGLSTRMLIGLVSGAALGVMAHLLLGGSAFLDGVISYLTDPVGRIFLRLLFMLVLPLIISALALGVAELRDLRELGRIGLKTLAYTVFVSSVAVVIGVALVNLIRPGDGLPPQLRDQLTARAVPPPAAALAAGASGIDFVVQLVPSNLIKAMTDGDMLAVMVFALFLGIGLVVTRTESARAFERGLQGLYDVTMHMLGLVIRFAPYGVACLLFSLTARLGYDILRQLGWFVLTVVLGLAIHQFGVYALTVRLLGGMSPQFFYRAVRPAMITAFSTASSNATLPTALEVAEDNLHLPPQVSRFVLTLGSTANQNGTALFEGVTVLFLAQFYGVHLALPQQVLVVFICILGGIGTAGVPAGSIPVIAMILGLIGIPPDGIGIILGVDRVLDMCRTTVNVTGDLAAAVVVARGERSEA